MEVSRWQDQLIRLKSEGTKKKGEEDLNTFKTSLRYQQWALKSEKHLTLYLIATRYKQIMCEMTDYYTKQETIYKTPFAKNNKLRKHHPEILNTCQTSSTSLTEDTWLLAIELSQKVSKHPCNYEKERKQFQSDSKQLITEMKLKLHNLRIYLDWPSARNISELVWRISNWKFEWKVDLNANRISHKMSQFQKPYNNQTLKWAFWPSWT